MKPMTDEEIKYRHAAMNGAINAVEDRVKALDKWADENAKKKDYSSAGAMQKSAVDLHCAVALIKEALFPSMHTHSGFRSDLGDVCPCCELEDWLRRVDRGIEK